MRLYLAATAVWLRQMRSTRGTGGETLQIIQIRKWPIGERNRYRGSMIFQTQRLPLNPVASIEKQLDEDYRVIITA